MVKRSSDGKSSVLPDFSDLSGFGLDWYVEDNELGKVR